MGGLEDDGNSSVIGANGKASAGLHADRELAGGIHGNNHLCGNSPLDCVVFGRAIGKHASKFVLGDCVATLSLKTLYGGGLTGDEENSKLTGGSCEDNTSKGAAAASGGGGGGDGYSLADVANWQEASMLRAARICYRCSRRRQTCGERHGRGST